MAIRLAPAPAWLPVRDWPAPARRRHRKDDSQSRRRWRDCSRWFNSIAADNQTTGSHVGSPYTIAHTNTAGNYLTVRCSVYNATGGQSVSGITYNGVALGKLVSVLTGGGDVSMEIWGLKAPATGANNVVITYAGTNVNSIVCVNSYTGVDQTTPTGNTNSATGTSTTPSVTSTSATGEWVLDATGSAGQTLTVAGQTEDYKTGGVGFQHAAGGASVVMSWTANVSASWAICCANLKPSTLVLPVFMYQYRQRW